MSSMRSATSAAHRVPNHVGPNPRAAGLSALSPPQRIAGSYPSFQPAGGLAPGVLRHHGAAVPSARPYDCGVRNASPGQTHPSDMAGNSPPVYSHGCKCPLPVAEWVAGKPGCRTSGRILYISYSSRGRIRARLHPSHHHPALRRVDRGLRLGAAHRRAARSLAGNPDSPQAVVFLTSIID